jgi:hypothetical protein
MNTYEHRIIESDETPTVTKVWLDGERLLGLTPDQELLVVARMKTAPGVATRVPTQTKRKKKPGGMARSPLQSELPQQTSPDGEQAAHDD